VSAPQAGDRSAGGGPPRTNASPNNTVGQRADTSQ